MFSALTVKQCGVSELGKVYSSMTEAMAKEMKHAKDDESGSRTCALHQSS